MLSINPRGNRARCRKLAALKYSLSVTALSATIAVCIASAITTPASAQQPAAQHFPVNLGPASVEDGLRYLQREMGVQVIYSPGQVRERKTRGVVGEFTPEQALKALLEGTGLRVRAKGNSFVISESEASAAQEAPTLQRAAASADSAVAPQPSTSSAATAATDLEEVVVTGTRVVRDGYNAPTPLTVVGEEALAAAAPVNVADYVNQMPAVIGSTTPRSNSANASGGLGGINALSLRGLGISRTLVLLDGQRSVASATNGAIDVTDFPQSLIQRVDVVTGGASAAYGSDAVGGVVNFVLDRQFTGIKGELSGGISTYGDNANWKAELSGGTDFASGRGHFLFSAEASDLNGVPQAKMRDWAFDGYETLQNPTYSATNGQPQYLFLPQSGVATATEGGLITNTALKGIAFGPGGTPMMFNYGLVSGNLMSGGDWRLSNNLKIALLDPPLRRQSVFTRASYDLTDAVEVFVQLSWASSRSTNTVAPVWNLGNLVVQSSNPFLPSAVATQAAALGITQFNMGRLHTDHFETTDETIQGIAGDNSRRVNRYVVGANGTLDAFASTWDWDVYYQKGVTHTSESTHNVSITANFLRAVDAVRNPSTGAIVCRSTLTDPGNGCVPYNPFGIGVNGPATLNYVYGRPLRQQVFTQDVAAATVSGEPFSNWVGPISFATGIEWRKEQSRGMVDPVSQVNGWFSSNYQATVGSYTVAEGFMETVVPLAQDTSWARQLDLNAAVRFTDYSTAGFTTTWKVGTTYQVVDDVRIRASISRDFRAPNMGDAFAGGTSSAGQGLTDPFNNNAPVASTTLTRGNPNLGPEKAVSTGVGMVVQPSFIPGLSASVDYWNIDLKDGIGSLSPQQILNNCFLGRQELCAAISRPNGLLTINNQPFNIATQTTRGVDFEAGYRTALDEWIDSWSGDLSFRFLATRYIKNVSDNQITPPIDSVGANGWGTGAVPKFNYNATVSYSYEPITISLTMRGFSAGRSSATFIECAANCQASTLNNPTVNSNYAPGAMYFNSSFNYKISDSTNFFFNVQNIANKNPPQLPNLGTAFSWAMTKENKALYDIVGRTFRAGVRLRM